MEPNFEICAITGYPNTHGVSNDGQTIIYNNDCTGNVRITLAAFLEMQTGKFERYIIGGICKHRTIFGKEPLLINSEFIREG